MLLLQLFAISLLGLSPLLLWLGQRYGLLPPWGMGLPRRRSRWGDWDNSRAGLGSDRGASLGRWNLGRLDAEIPEQRYVEGVGFVVGDLSCEFNAKSPQLRCAVNPIGPCRGCLYYQAKSFEAILEVPAEARTDWAD